MGRRGRYALGLAAAVCLLATPSVRTLLESRMATHMFVQLPLLVAVGYVACRLLPDRVQRALLEATGGAIPWLVLMIFASTCWMLPRSLDAALTSPWAAVAKFTTIPLCIGAPLAVGWRGLTIVGRGFVLTNFASMIAVLGWLYLAAPVRVCNNYTVAQQADAGQTALAVAGVLFGTWLVSLFGARWPSNRIAAEGDAPLPEGIARG